MMLLLRVKVAAPTYLSCGTCGYDHHHQGSSTVQEEGLTGTMQILLLHKQAHDKKESLHAYTNCL